jgi:membrane associated rhomboid family serine protease
MDSRSPTLQLALACVVVFALQWFGDLLNLYPRFGSTLLALALPLEHRPWTLLTSVFAHGGFGHLLSNLVALLLFGLLLERYTSRPRFLAFFVVTGALTGVAQVSLGQFVPGAAPGVWGASGAIFALAGYLIGGNRLTNRVLAGVNVSPRAQLALFLLLAGVLTLVTGSSEVALVGHFTGLLLGLLAGRAHILRTDASDPEPTDPEPW